MIETFEHKGKWKLPESDNWFYGTLNFDPDNGARLEIFGSFNTFLDRSSKAIVLGKTIAGDITLIDVWYRTTRSSSNGIIVGVYRPQIIIEGHHFKNESEICFRHVTSKIFNLYQWFDQSGTEENYDYSNGNYRISYSKLAPISFKLNDGCEGKVLFDSPVSFGDFSNEKNIKEQSYFSLDYKEKTYYEDILDDLRYLTGFITLFTYEQSYPLSITFRDEDYSESFSHRSHLKYIKCFYQNSLFNSKYKLRVPHEHLVKYESVTDSFPGLIKKWYEMYQEYESVFTLMLTSFRQKNHFSVEKFMDTIKAIESFHRNSQNNERIPQKDYESLVDKILQSVNLNEDDTLWLENKLKGNEPSLNKRLVNLIRENQNIFIIENILDEKKFAREITSSRNYYTHYDKTKEKEALKGKELFEATVNLMALLYSMIFKELGLKNANFEEGLKYHLYK
jgi:hypothetical protein